MGARAGPARPPLSGSMETAACRKFQANVFNHSKCQNCFKARDSHLASDRDLTQVSGQSAARVPVCKWAGPSGGPRPISVTREAAEPTIWAAEEKGLCTGRLGWGGVYGLSKVLHSERERRLLHALLSLGESYGVPPPRPDTVCLAKLGTCLVQ